jgi:hypothetical protein
MQMNKSMRKIILLFLLPLLTFTCKVVGQQTPPTYTIEVTYNVPTQKFCYTGNYGWLLSGDGNYIGGIVKNKIHLVTETDDFLTIPNYNNFDFSIFATCYDKNGNAISCSDQYIGKLTAVGLIMNGNFSLERCGESVEIVSFKPNVTIANSKSSNEICAGEELNLQAYPGLVLNKFPDEAYHWQYSIDNQTTWIDVPITKSNTTQTSFRIDEIIANSEQYFGKTINFRLGYGQNRPFTDVIPITYSPCGPVITGVSFVGPQCNGDTVKSLAVTFGEKLDSSIGEKLATMSVCDINDNSKIFMQVDGPILYPDGTKTYTYTKFGNLETGNKYKIRYQAQITDPKDPAKTIMRGVLDSPALLNFLYEDPEKFNFTANATPAQCNGADGAIEILAWGGSSPYKYQLDNGTETPFLNPSTIVDGTISKQKIVITAGSVPNPNPNISTNHSILVTDNKGCIDKTANE